MAFLEFSEIYSEEIWIFRAIPKGSFEGREKSVKLGNWVERIKVNRKQRYKWDMETAAYLYKCVCACVWSVLNIGLENLSLKMLGEQRGKTVKSSSSHNAAGNTDQQMAHVSGNLFHCTKE